MEVDGTQLASRTRLEAEIAIVGSGPAGIVLALELAARGIQVLLIESGGGDFDPEVQDLGDTFGEDPPHVPMSLTTRRQIGGASNIWAGRCVPFDPIDFEPRESIGDARWPLTYEDLEDHLARACEWLVCGEPRFDVHDIPRLARRAMIPGWPAGEIRASSLERWSLPTNFRQRYREQLRASPRITLVTRLTCTEIVAASASASASEGEGEGAGKGQGEGSRIAHLVCRTLTGEHVTVRAGRYVLACGGLEATRLLLASKRVHPDGIGNHSGHLGRWYMAHAESRIAKVHFSTPPAETIYDYERDHDGVYVARRFTFAPEFLIEHNLPNSAMWLANPEIRDPEHGSEVLSLLYLMLASPLGRYLISEGIRQSQIKGMGRASKLAHLANILRHLGSATRFALSFGYQRFLRRGHKAPGLFIQSSSNVYPLVYHGEHLPSRASHVALTDQRDALGMPRLRTCLRFEDADIDGMIRAHRHLDEYLRRHGLGHLEYLYDDLHAAIRRQLFGGYHQAGTTRMSASPEDGVLTRDLAVHGFEDLFVASSSAFVTSSQANTTFMIVVFALRLADHLEQLVRRGQPTDERDPEKLASLGGVSPPAAP